MIQPTFTLKKICPLAILFGCIMANAIDEISPTCSGINRAFLFVKPNAVTPQAVSLVRERLADFKISVVDEGVLDGATIENEMLIDHHYGAIASKAVKLKPNELALSPDAKVKFRTAYKEDFESALDEGRVLNAKDACAQLGLTAASLGDRWADSVLVKFGGGFYCGRVATNEEDHYIYVINGFYMAMRSMYVEPSASILWMCLEWPESTLSWKAFRHDVVGATDPSTASPSSIRRSLLEDWSSLGLSNRPSIKENSLHASASPFEALCERMNWLRLKSAEEDPFGREVLAGLHAAGKTVDLEEAVNRWQADPGCKSAHGIGLFDHLEDRDATDCLAELLKEA